MWTHHPYFYHCIMSLFIFGPRQTERYLTKAQGLCSSSVYSHLSHRFLHMLMACLTFISVMPSKVQWRWYSPLLNCIIISSSHNHTESRRVFKTCSCILWLSCIFQLKNLGVLPVVSMPLNWSRLLKKLVHARERSWWKSPFPLFCSKDLHTERI